MTRYEWNRIEKEQLNPLLARQMMHGERLTVAQIHLAKGCVVPEHSHENEQISLVQSGKLVFRTPQGDITLVAGQAAQIPPHEPHSVEALEDSLAIDVFVPVREDWRAGTDAYLRK